MIDLDTSSPFDIARALMRGDEANLKAGYSLESAVLAVGDLARFEGLDLDALREQLRAADADGTADNDYGRPDHPKLDGTATALADVETLYVECVDYKPVSYSWGGFDANGERQWRSLSLECDCCGMSPKERRESLDSDDDLAGWYTDGSEPSEGQPCLFSGCSGDYFGAEPMMNYYYPLPSQTFGADNAEAIENLPVVLVEIDGEYALALSGGGMDLSWEICEAYMRLGFLPPFHFTRLPGMAGKPDGAVDAWVIAGAKRSCEVIAGWVKRRSEDLATDL